MVIHHKDGGKTERGLMAFHLLFVNVCKKLSLFIINTLLQKEPIYCIRSCILVPGWLLLTPKLSDENSACET